MANTRSRRKEKKAARKQLWATINQLTPAILIQQLDTQGLSIIGNLNELRHRLYRFSIMTADPDATPQEWNPAVDERPNYVLPATTAGMNMQVSYIDEQIPLPRLQESTIPQNRTPRGRGPRGVDQITKSIEEAAAAPAYVQCTIPGMRSTPIVKDSEVASQPIHARLLQQSKAFADKVMSVTNQTANASCPPPVNNFAMNSEQNPVLQSNPVDNHELVDILTHDSSSQSSLRSHRSRENHVDQELKRLQREIRRLQVRGNPRDSPSLLALQIGLNIQEGGERHLLVKHQEEKGAAMIRREEIAYRSTAGAAAAPHSMSKVIGDQSLALVLREPYAMRILAVTGAINLERKGEIDVTIETIIIGLGEDRWIEIVHHRKIPLKIP